MSDTDTITDELIEAEAQEWKQQEAARRMARVLFEVSGNNLELAIAAVLEAAATQRGLNRALGPRRPDANQWRNAMAKRTYRVTVKRLVEYSATVKILASSQASADRKAMAAYHSYDGDEDFPPLWHVNMPIDHELEIDTRFRCVDCNFDTLASEYYMAADEVWAASGVAKNGGMLCLACLERRIGRELVPEDFTTLWPSDEAWQRHLAAREMVYRPGHDAAPHHVPRIICLEEDAQNRSY